MPARRDVDQHEVGERAADVEAEAVARTAAPVRRSPLDVAPAIRLRRRRSPSREDLGDRPYSCQQLTVRVRAQRARSRRGRGARAAKPPRCGLDVRRVALATSAARIGSISRRWLRSASSSSGSDRVVMFEHEPQLARRCSRPTPVGAARVRRARRAGRGTPRRARPASRASSAAAASAMRRHAASSRATGSVVQVLDHELDGVRLEQAAQAVDLVDQCGRQLLDVLPAPRHVKTMPSLSSSAKRLADRAAADLQLAGQLGLDEALARREAPGQDRFADRLGDGLDERRGGHRPEPLAALVSCQGIRRADGQRHGASRGEPATAAAADDAPSSVGHALLRRSSIRTRPGSSMPSKTMPQPGGARDQRRRARAGTSRRAPRWRGRRRRPGDHALVRIEPEQPRRRRRDQARRRARATDAARRGVEQHGHEQLDVGRPCGASA